MELEMNKTKPRFGKGFITFRQSDNSVNYRQCTVSCLIFALNLTVSFSFGVPLINMLQKCQKNIAIILKCCLKQFESFICSNSFPFPTSPASCLLFSFVFRNTMSQVWVDLQTLDTLTVATLLKKMSLLPLPTFTASRSGRVTLISPKISTGLLFCKSCQSQLM